MLTKQEPRLELRKIIVKTDDNPIMWSDDSFKSRIDGKVIVGYIIRAKKNNDGYDCIMNLYTCDIDRLLKSSYSKIVTIDTLREKYLEWLSEVKDNVKSISFQNPPLTEWLETKDNWCMKVAGELSKKYFMPFDEVMSVIYYTIVDCYNKPKVYMGNLYYIEIAVNNNIKSDMKFMRNRLHGDNPNMIHLDASPGDYGAQVDEGVKSFYEMIPSPNPEIDNFKLEELKKLIIKDLSKEFSEREIDQIINNPKYLTRSLTRRLHKWRETHKMEDYCE